MTKSNFYICLSLIIISTLGLIGGAFYHFRDDFEDKEFSKADLIVDGIIEEDTSMDDFPYYDQRQRLEEEWKVIEHRLELDEMEAALSEAYATEELPSTEFPDIPEEADVDWEDAVTF